MPDPAYDMPLFRHPTPDRPLAGHTMLLVEDSRYASEALRLMCLHSGARIRRADTLASARRHLRTYRPSVMIIDLGLPDGDGTELIAELAGRPSGIEAMLAISGDETASTAALASGAHAFLSKPLNSLALFQATVIGALPEHLRMKGPRPQNEIAIDPDPLALSDDLGFAAQTLRQAQDTESLAYAAAFLAGVARSAGERPLEEAAGRLRQLATVAMPDAETVEAVASQAETKVGARGLV